jgi:hypothetical protein
MKRTGGPYIFENSEISGAMKIARKNWADWRDVFEHRGPIAKNPILADGETFRRFCAEYYVNRAIRKGFRERLRKELLGSSKFCIAINSGRPDDLDKLEKDLRRRFGSKSGKNRLTSALSKLATFVRPARFVAWDRFAKRGLNSVLGRGPLSYFRTYSAYLADFDKILRGPVKRRIKRILSKGPHTRAEFNERFLRRVLDVLLMKCGGRWDPKEWREIVNSVAVQSEYGIYPDFGARAKRIFGNKQMSQTGTELVAEFRGDY